MKRNFKKIISLFLTVVMLVSLLIPVTVNADTAEPIYLEKNTTATINGITYRFDTNKADDADSWVRVNPDGTWEISIRNGDMLWFPDIELTATSEVYAEVTNTDTEPMNYFGGLAYGVVSNNDANWSTTNVAVLRTQQNDKVRLRATGATPSDLKSVNGEDYGNGGASPRMFNNEFALNDAWNSIANPINKNWDAGKTVYYKVSQVSGKVVLEYGAPGMGSFVDSANTSYTEGVAGSYSVAGGSVGYTQVWQTNDTEHSQFRIEDITITNCKVGGELKDSYSLGATQDDGEEPDEPIVPPVISGDPIYLEKNTTATINGITYRFDTNKADDADSWARVNPDGSWEINIRNGDMLWFPDIKMTATSEVYAEVTNTDNEPMNYFSGMAYGVTSSTNSAWISANVAVLKTQQNDKVRLRATPATPSALKGVSGSDYGNGGASPRMFDNNSIAINSAWNSVANATNKNWDAGKTVYFKVSQTEEKVLLEYGAPGVGAFVDSSVTSYNQGVSGSYNVAGGSVGYTLVWQTNDTAHSQFRIENITITNCEVGGVAKDSYSVKANQYDIADAKANLSLDGTIGLNFAFKAGATLPEGATVVVTKNGEVIANQAVVEGQNLVTAPVNAKEMTDDVNFSIKVDGEVFDNHTYTVSVAEYAAQLLEDEDWGDLMQAMLNYGAAAQMALNYKTNDLAANISGGITYDFSGYEAITFTGDRDILTGLYMNLVLESDTAFKVYFKPATGVELAVTVNGEAAELTENGDGYYVLTVGNIAADKLVDDFAIVVNENLSFAVNALDWAKIASEGTDANLATLAKAMAAYADAAARKN